MNILFVSPEFPKDKFSPTGGIGTYLVNLTSQLVKSGHQITLITRKGGNKYRYKYLEIIEIDCNINNKKIKGSKFVDKLISFIEYPIIFSLKTAFIISGIVKNYSIDIIESNDFGGDLWFYLINQFIKKTAPVVIRLHTPYFVISKFNNDSGSIMSKVMSFFEKTAITLADEVYSPTKNLARLITKETGRKIDKIIPYPFEVNKLKPASVKRKRWTILYVGKLQYKKGVFKLLNAVAYLKRIHNDVLCRFIGSDTLFQNSWVSDLMKIRVNKLNISDNIKIINNNINKKELNGYYKISSVLVVPSLWENFPNVILEAFLFGVPVVACAVGGIPEMITDGYNGLLYKPNNEKQLANAVLKIIKNPKHAHRLSKNAYNTLNNRYNTKEVSLETVSFYEYVIKNSKI